MRASFSILRQDFVPYVHYVVYLLPRRNKSKRNCLDYLESGVFQRTFAPELNVIVKQLELVFLHIFALFWLIIE